MNKPNKNLSNEINFYLSKLFPINRSITGDGNRKTLRILNEIIKFDIKEYKSGSKVYDWTIPYEWEVKEAWIKDQKGNTLIDYKDNNIHLVSYSNPVKKFLSFNKLKNHLSYIKDKPDAIPYRTAYYNNDWGFCLSQKQYNKIKNISGKFEVFIDSKFKKKGSLTIGELLIPGKSKQEILVSTYFCHPSLANDNLSGTLLTTFLARELSLKKKLYYSYRFIWIPETIGAIAYCFKNEKILKNINIGFVISNVGGKGEFSYKQSWDKKHPINNYAENVLNQYTTKFKCYPFDIHGSDERQYSSQGFRINTITISKDKYYEYPEYHTSLDNLEFVNGNQIAKTYQVYNDIIKLLEKRVIFKTVMPYCEIMLSKYNLYPRKGGSINPSFRKKSELDKILWILFLSNGDLSTKEIAKKINGEHKNIYNIYLKLEKHGVVKRV